MPNSAGFLISQEMLRFADVDVIVVVAAASIPFHSVLLRNYCGPLWLILVIGAVKLYYSPTNITIGTNLISNYISDRPTTVTQSCVSIMINFFTD